MSVKDKAKLVSRIYGVTTSVRKFIRMTDREELLMQRCEPCLSDKLVDIDGVSDVQYNGHFGPTVWFKLDEDENNDATWEKLDEVFKEFKMI